MISFQARALNWATQCFKRADALLTPQRSFRFGEEAIELMQAAGTPRADVDRLTAYVYERPIGDVRQEIGGVALTLALLAESCGVKVELAAEEELDRCHHNTAKIREKDLAKPERSPLPGSAPDLVMSAAPDDDAMRELWRLSGGKFHGPNVETGTMPEALLLPFLRKLMAAGYKVGAKQ